jgi:hypothetical protein
MRALRRLLHRIGVDVVRHRPIPPHLARRAALLRHLAPAVRLALGDAAGTAELNLAGNS